MASTDTHQIYLITGANRGIGRAVLEQLVARDHSTVIAGVRDPSHQTVQSLADVTKGQESRVVAVKLDSASETDAHSAIEELRQKHGIQRLDTVIANAGIAQNNTPAIGAEGKFVRAHMDVNFIGPLQLIQASLPLLSNSPHPKFVAVSSGIGSISAMEKKPAPMFSYGVSKAALNYLVRKIHLEHQNVVSFAVDPGFVQSDMGNAGARAFGMAEAPVTLVDSAKFIISQIDIATRDNMSGKFPSIEGGFFEW